jgi:hypothetical protein
MFGLAESGPIRYIRRKFDKNMKNIFEKMNEKQKMKCKIYEFRDENTYEFN